jgi:hypothetical protein
METRNVFCAVGIETVNKRLSIPTNRGVRESLISSCLPNCSPDVSTHPEGPATGHLSTNFLCLPPSSNKCWDGSQVANCYCVPLMQPSRLKFIKMKPRFCQSYQNIVPKLYSSALIQKIKILRPLSQATTSKHHNFFSFTVPLPQGWEGEAWEPSNLTMLFLPPPRNKIPQIHLWIFCLCALIFQTVVRKS